jgi:hypothetical protein
MVIALPPRPDLAFDGAWVIRIDRGAGS